MFVHFSIGRTFDCSFNVFFFFFKQKTAYEMLRSLVGSEMCIRDSINAEYGEIEVSMEWVRDARQISAGRRSSTLPLTTCLVRFPRRGSSDADCRLGEENTVHAVESTTNSSHHAPVRGYWQGRAKPPLDVVQFMQQQGRAGAQRYDIGPNNPAEDNRGRSCAASSSQHQSHRCVRAPPAIDSGCAAQNNSGYGLLRDSGAVGELIQHKSIHAPRLVGQNGQAGYDGTHLKVGPPWDEDGNIEAFRAKPVPDAPQPRIGWTPRWCSFCTEDGSYFLAGNTRRWLQPRIGARRCGWCLV
eukprot:TRINITY_DN14065_c0_g1_i1.p1 TRINITY_DN14065_c0_g1~~TRINITY_DN14065_c0_g1_i1.p1  ORF type:complete len:298 (-),score=51.14 TRINITY_DN14065_c0_g1_i1:370-1263(-)